MRAALGRGPGQLLKDLVETDETFVGGARSGGKRGRGAPDQTMVAVLVERRQDGACAAFLATVPDGSFESLGPVLHGAGEGASTTFVTEGDKGSLPLASQGVEHEAYVQGPPERAGEILPWVHAVISNLESWLRGTVRGVSHKHLPSYLLELTCRLHQTYRRLTPEAIG